MLLLICKAPGWALALRFTTGCGINLYNTWMDDAGLNEDDWTLRTISATPPGAFKSPRINVADWSKITKVSFYLMCA